MSLTLADLGITSNEFVSRKLVELDASQTALNEKFESTLKDKFEFAKVNEIEIDRKFIKNQLINQLSKIYVYEF